MPLVRKRRAQPEPQEEESDNDAVSETSSRHRRRTENESAASAAASSDSETNEPHAPSSMDVMVKKMVRLVLASEYSRLPIRRTDISAKVLGEQGSRQFKPVFNQAQRMLRSRFGMQMVELPGKEKITISQRRAAQRIEKPSTASKSWILTSTLPAPYRSPTILPPTKAPSSFNESVYTAIYTFLISIITLSGGSIPEQKLDRYLKRTNIDTYTPIDRTDRLLQRLCKDGYLVRNREMDGGEEVIEYMIGPRGKIEVGESGVAGLVREVYGQTDMMATGDDAPNGAGGNNDANSFDQRLKRSLAASRRDGPQIEVTEPDNEPADQGRGNRRNQPNRRNTRGRAAQDDEMNEDYE